MSSLHYICCERRDETASVAYKDYLTKLLRFDAPYAFITAVIFDWFEVQVIADQQPNCPDILITLLEAPATNSWQGFSNLRKGIMNILSHIKWDQNNGSQFDHIHCHIISKVGYNGIGGEGMINHMRKEITFELANNINNVQFHLVPFSLEAAELMQDLAIEGAVIEPYVIHQQQQLVNEDENFLVSAHSLTLPNDDDFWSFLDDENHDDEQPDFTLLVND